MDKIIYQHQLDYVNSFRKTDELLSEMEKFALEKNVPILDWQSANLLEMVIQMIKPSRVLEIGTAIAYSSIRMARVIGNKGVVHTIEKSKDNIKLASDFISRAGLDKKIKILKGNAFEIMPGLDKKYDLIFLDADKQDYASLLDISYKLLKKNGIMFVDNLLWHGHAAAKSVPDNMKTSTENVRAFNKLFTNYPGLCSSIFTVGDGIGLGIKSKKRCRQTN